jgi:hypothetical protein
MVSRVKIAQYFGLKTAIHSSTMSTITHLCADLYCLPTEMPKWSRTQRGKLRVSKFTIYVKCDTPYFFACSCFAQRRNKEARRVSLSPQERRGSPLVCTQNIIALVVNLFACIYHCWSITKQDLELTTAR